MDLNEKQRQEQVTDEVLKTLALARIIWQHKFNNQHLNPHSDIPREELISLANLIVQVEQKQLLEQLLKNEENRKLGNSQKAKRQWRF